MTAVDRYEPVAAKLATMGWMLDLALKGPRKAMIEMLQSREVVTLLDACCGSGTFTRYATDAGMTVTGADLSPSMLALAEEKSPHLTFIKADLTDYRFNESFDAAVIALALHEMSEDLRQSLWAGLKAAVRPGGVIIVADNTESGRKGLYAHICRRIIYGDEKAIGRHDPDHYLSFLQWMEKGGLKAWLKRQGEHICEERLFMGGYIGVYAVGC